MSLLAISLTIQQKIADPLAKFLLVLLADRHNADTGECYPSVNRLVQDSGMSRSTVLRKLQWLQENGLVIASERTRDNGSTATNNYTLTYVPEANPEDMENAKKTSRRALPPMDWQPSEASINKIKERYPHHDTGPETIEYITREWIGYCHARNVLYAQFDAAWLNSAERVLRRQPVGKALGANLGAKRGGAGALSGAVRRALARERAGSEPDQEKS